MNNRYIGALILAPLIIFLFLGGNIFKISSNGSFTSRDVRIL